MLGSLSIMDSYRTVPHRTIILCFFVYPVTFLLTTVSEVHNISVYVVLGYVWMLAKAHPTNF